MGVVLKVPLNVTLSPSVTLRINSAKGLGVVGFMRTVPRLALRFFVASLLRMTFDTEPLR
jgi:hypothetical protein